MREKKQLRALFASVAMIFALVLVVGTVSKSTVSAASNDKYPYLIKVNKQANTVTIYKKNSSGKYTVPVKAMVCSTGRATPTGTFRTKAKYRWKVLMHNVWGQYSTRIVGGILFHSVYYYEKNPATLAVAQYNKLGTTASAGCVRLTTVDAKWIYDNCGVGTTVVIYKSSNPGPLGKPKAIKLSGKYKWDPTDVWSKNNPYNKMKPKITGAKDVTVAYKSKVDLKKGIKAYNTTGYNITSSLKVSGKVDTSVVGKYKVTYSVKDEIGRTAKKTVTYTVKGNSATPTLKGVKTRVYSYNTYKDKSLKSYVMSGITGYIGSEKLSSKQLTYTAKTVSNTDSMKKIQVIYTATNPYTKKKTTATGYIILDKQSPTVTAPSEKYLTTKAFSTLQTALKKGDYSLISIKDNYSKEKYMTVSYKITKSSSTYYQIQFTVTDQAKNTTKKTVKVYLLTNPKLSAVKSTIQIKSASVLTDAYLKSQVKFTATGKDYTAKFKNQIKYTKSVSSDKLTYTVKYKLALENDQTLTTTIKYVLPEKVDPTPTPKPTQQPTATPKPEPTVQPTLSPTVAPTAEPTKAPATAE